MILNIYFRDRFLFSVDIKTVIIFILVVAIFIIMQMYSNDIQDCRNYYETLFRNMNCIKSYNI